MASTIQLKRGSGAPTSGDLAAGELGLDLTNNKIYSSTDGSDVVEMGLSPTSPTFSGTVKFDGYAPTVAFDFNGDSSVASADTLAYTKFGAGIGTGTDISSYVSFEPDWTAPSGVSYANNKFRILTVKGNSVDCARVASSFSIEGHGDSVLIGNVNLNGSNTVLQTGIAIDGPYLNLITDSYPIYVGGTLRPTIDNVSDLGTSSLRWDDVYATNGTIQTSDANEKQDIAELSTAEQLVAVKCKALLRKYRWKDSVAEKGDDARIHFGIIAQDLKAAFESEGLDAGRYGMFISNTWTDESGVEHTRLGVRYNQLFAFVLAAI